MHKLQLILALQTHPGLAHLVILHRFKSLSLVCFFTATNTPLIPGKWDEKSMIIHRTSDGNGLNPVFKRALKITQAKYALSFNFVIIYVEYCDKHVVVQKTRIRTFNLDRFILTCPAESAYK
jgi:hypothetical protein